MIQANERKLAELILYISQKLADDPYFGATKLHKALFFPDFTAYASWGESITGAEYQHLKEGPTVRRLLPVQDALRDEGDLAIQPTNCFGYPQKRPVNLREPDLSVFDAREIALVDAWLDRLRPMTATEVSRLSHETAGWQVTRDGETISPKSVFIGWVKPDAAEIRRGRELAALHGLLV